jgi:hypothetical protein
MATSYDGRFVTFPCYVSQGQKTTTSSTGAVTTTAGAYLKLGSKFNNPCCTTTPLPATCTSCPVESLSYDDKAIAMLRWDGVVDTITHLPGNQFFYGPIIPDEPQYVTAAITTGELWPFVSYFSGNAGDNGEGTMNIPFDALAPTKSGNRITNTPGYFDYGQARSRSRLCTRHARCAPEMRADDTCAATRAARRCYAMRAAGAASYALACTRREALAVLQQRS